MKKTTETKYKADIFTDYERYIDNDKAKGIDSNTFESAPLRTITARSLIRLKAEVQAITGSLYLDDGSDDGDYLGYGDFKNDDGLDISVMYTVYFYKTETTETSILLNNGKGK